MAVLRTKDNININRITKVNSKINGHVRTKDKVKRSTLMGSPRSTLRSLAMLRTKDKINFHKVTI